MSSFQDQHRDSDETQMDPRLTALRCLFILAQHHGVQISSELLASTHDNDTIRLLLRLMRYIQLSGKLLKHRKWNDLSALGSAYPVMAELTDGSWVIVVGSIPMSDGTFSLAVLDPRNEQKGTTLITRDEFEELWSRRLLLCKRVYHLTDVNQPFGFRWFGTVLMPNAHYLRDMAILSITLSVITFATPLLFQLMIDKVVPHHSYTTMWSLVAVFTVLALFEGLFSYSRSVLTMFLSNKADAQLASRTYEHVLSLPLSFFEGMPTGVLVRNVLQTESVRSFLTGPLFHTLLDLTTLPILLLGLMYYSFKLTLMVLAFSAVIAAVTAAMVPMLRRKLDFLYSAEGARQADLVETIHGMRAVKSLALETPRQKLWDSKVVKSIQSRMSVFYVMTAGSTSVSVLQKLMNIAILCLGVYEVFDGNLTIGGLVAFFMLSGSVSGPLVQVVTLINEYQQVALSVKMLGSVMNHPAERSPDQHGAHPPITGKIEFDQISFTYDGSPRPALNRISFNAEEGQMIGIVGRSGSGKTTVTRLIQGISAPQEGLIRLSGVDIRHIDLTHLRRNIGVVLQENLLFRGTLRDNIAITKPDASLEEVM